MKKLGFLVLCLSVVFVACKKETVDQRAVDEGLIQQYIADNNLTATETGTGLYVVIEDSGFGGFPDVNSTVTTYYTGKLLNGKKFDEAQRPNSPLSFPLGAVIQGWREGIPHFQKEGKGILLIPSHLGYGGTASSNIPANSVLIFDLELVDFY